MTNRTGSSAVGARRDELLDLDRADRLEGNACEVLVGDHDVLVLGVLEALDRVAPRYHVVMERAVRLHLDSVQAARMEHIERDALRVRRQVEPNRNGHQAELDGPPPHRARHGPLVCLVVGRRVLATSWPASRDRDGKDTPGAQVAQRGGRTWASSSATVPSARLMINRPAHEIGATHAYSAGETAFRRRCLAPLGWNPLADLMRIRPADGAVDSAATQLGHRDGGRDRSPVHLQRRMMRMKSA